MADQGREACDLCGGVRCPVCVVLFGLRRAPAGECPECVTLREEVARLRAEVAELKARLPAEGVQVLDTRLLEALDAVRAEQGRRQRAERGG